MVTSLEVSIPVQEATLATPQAAGATTRAGMGFGQVFAAQQEAVADAGTIPSGSAGAGASPAAKLPELSLVDASAPVGLPAAVVSPVALVDPLSAPLTAQGAPSAPAAPEVEAAAPDCSLIALLASLWLPSQGPMTAAPQLTAPPGGAVKGGGGSQLLEWHAPRSASEPEGVVSVPAMISEMLAASSVAAPALVAALANADSVAPEDGHPLANPGDPGGGEVRPAVPVEAASSVLAAVPQAIPVSPPFQKAEQTLSPDAAEAELPNTAEPPAPPVAQRTPLGQSPPLRHARTAVLAAEDSATPAMTPEAWPAPVAGIGTPLPAIPAAAPAIVSERSRLQVSSASDAITASRAEPAAIASRSAEPIAGPQPALVPLASQHVTPVTGPPPLPNPVERLVAHQVTRALIRRPDGGGDRSLTIRLTPPELGTVRVEIQERDGQFTARLHADDPAVRQALERVLPQMRSELRLNDSPVHHITVAANNAPDQGFDGRGFDGRGGAPQSDNGRHSGRQRRGDRPAFTLDHEVGAIGETAAAAPRPRGATGLVDALA